MSSAGKVSEVASSEAVWRWQAEAGGRVVCASGDSSAGNWARELHLDGYENRLSEE